MPLHPELGDLAMLLAAIVSFAFSAWIGWTLATSVRDEKLYGWRDWISTIWIACGSLAGAVTAIVAALK